MLSVSLEVQILLTWFTFTLPDGCWVGRNCWDMSVDVRAQSVISEQASSDNLALPSICQLVSAMFR